MHDDEHSFHADRFLETSLFAGASTLVASRLAFANAPTDARFVFVLLRGALDGLVGRAAGGRSGLRGPARPDRAGEVAARARRCRSKDRSACIPRSHSCTRVTRAKELAVLHAVATPYRERSHFDAQNVLESGDLRPHGSTSGWINRALAALPAGTPREAGVALGANVPLAMRGPAEVASWSPTKIAALDDDDAGAHHRSVCARSAAVAAARRCARERCDRERGAGRGAMRRPSDAASRR